MNIDDMSLFVEVVKAKGFTNASNLLGIPTSTISVRINKLEKQLGLQLLNRTTRRVELTEVGKLYYQRALHIVEETKALHSQLGDMLDNPAGIVRVSMPVDFAYENFAPLIPKFYEQYPHITLHIDTSSRNVDLMSEPFDVAIRFGVPQDPNLIARPLGEYQFHLYASLDYLDRYGTPTNLADLHQHRLLAFGKMHEQNAWQLFCKKEQTVFEFKPIFSSNSLGLLQRLATQGLGVALLPDIFNNQPASKLVRIMPDYRGVSNPLHAVTSTRLLPKKVQVFIDFVKAHLPTP
ncbi:LysR substrate-binding domain-containing protein [Ursidibacter sp. B-7004-1]